MFYQVIPNQSCLNNLFHRENPQVLRIVALPILSNSPARIPMMFPISGSDVIPQAQLGQGENFHQLTNHTYALMCGRVQDSDLPDLR